MTQVQCSASYQQIRLDEFVNHVREEFSPASLIAKKSTFTHRGWGFLLHQGLQHILLLPWAVIPRIWNEATWFTNPV